MTKIGKVGVQKRRSRQEIKRLVREFETSGLRRSEFCHKHNLALGTLQRGLKRRRMEVYRQSVGKRLLEVKLSGIRKSERDDLSPELDKTDMVIRRLSRIKAALALFRSGA